MKKTFLFFIAFSVIAGSLIFTSCSDDDNENPINPPITPEVVAGNGEIKLLFEASATNPTAIVVMDASSAIIDWGEGERKDTLSNVTEHSEIRYTYSNTNKAYEITIKSPNAKYFSNNFSNNSKYKNIVFGKNLTKFEKLNLSIKNVDVIDYSKLNNDILVNLDIDDINFNFDNLITNKAYLVIYMRLDRSISLKNIASEAIRFEVESLDSFGKIEIESAPNLLNLAVGVFMNVSNNKELSFTVDQIKLVNTPKLENLGLSRIIIKDLNIKDSKAAMILSATDIDVINPITFNEELVSFILDYRAVKNYTNSHLKNLDFRNARNMINLKFVSHANLESINVDGLDKLEYIGLIDATMLKSLSINNLKKLNTIRYSVSQNLLGEDDSEDDPFGRLASATITNNPALSDVKISGSRLKNNLNISNNPVLSSVDLRNNLLTEAEMIKTINSLNNNPIAGATKTLDLRANPDVANSTGTVNANVKAAGDAQSNWTITYTGR